jgi:porin
VGKIIVSTIGLYLAMGLGEVWATEAVTGMSMVASCADQPDLTAEESLVSPATNNQIAFDRVELVQSEHNLSIVRPLASDELEPYSKGERSPLETNPCTENLQDAGDTGAAPPEPDVTANSPFLVFPEGAPFTFPTVETLQFSGETLSAEAFSAETYVPTTLELAQLPTSPPLTFAPSIRLNIWALRSLRKPVTNRRIDTGVSAGLIPRGDSFWTRDFLGGDWNGLRNELYDQHGIDVYAFYTGDTYGVVAGGLEQSAAHSSLLLFGFDLYTSRLGWWENGQIHVTSAFIETVSVGRDYAGALNSTFFGDPVQNGWRMFEVWYGQRWDAGRWEVRVGAIYPFVRLGTNMPSAVFTNASFDYPTFLGTTKDSGLSASFAAAPFGVQLAYAPSPEWFLISQISDGFQDPSGGFDNFQNLSVGLSGDEGIEGIVEAGYRLNQRPDSQGLPGNYKLGIQFHTGLFNNNNLAIGGLPRAQPGTTPLEERGNQAVYFVMDQMLTREADEGPGRSQGLTAFFQTTGALRQNVNTINFNLATGLVYEGLIPGRDHDVAGIGISYTHFSEGIRQFDRDQLALGLTTQSPRTGETVIEAIYGLELAPWWVVIGSAQHILQPSGRSNISNATVLGLSTRISF